MSQPEKTDSITFETLGKLIGVAQARQLWEQKRVAEEGITYDPAALEAMRRLLMADQLPTLTDVRAAAPALAAYLRGSFSKTRAGAREWATRHLRGEQVDEPKRTIHRRRPLGVRRRITTPELQAERDLAISQNLGFCPLCPEGARIQPRENFWSDKKQPNGLYLICKAHASEKARAYKYGTTVRSPLTKGEIIKKAQAIGVIFRSEQMRHPQLPHQELLERARRAWAEQHPDGFPEGEINPKDQEVVDELPPVPAEAGAFTPEEEQQ